MGNETSKSLGVLLEINFGNPCGAALSTEDRAWSVIDSIVDSSECAHFVLMGETDMSQDSHSDGYHMLIKNISSAFPKATVFYYGKQPNELSLEKAKEIGCKPVYRWAQTSNSNDSENRRHDYPGSWHCFSHRCMTSPLVKRMIQKRVLSSSESSQWYDLDAVTSLSEQINQEKASHIIQRAWRSYIASVSLAAMALSSVRVVDKWVIAAMENCLSTIVDGRFAPSTESIESVSPAESFKDKLRTPSKEKPSLLSPRSIAYRQSSHIGHNKLSIFPVRNGHAEKNPYVVFVNAQRSPCCN